MFKKGLRAIYEIIPAKKVLFSIWKFFGTPAEKTFRHLHFSGAFRVKVDDGHSFRIRNYGWQLENEIFWRGLYYRYEKSSLGLWSQLCQNSKVIIDVGANTGLYTLVAKAMNNAAFVHAFEPVEREFERLQENMKLNHFDVVAVKKALSNVSGASFIYDTNDDHEYAASLSKNVFGSDVRKEAIETVTMMDYIHQENLTQIDLMKIDVEGHEPQVLSGMGPYLQKLKPTMLIEIVEEENAKKIETLIDGIGYLLYDVDENKGCQLKSRLSRSSNNNWLLCSQEIARRLNLPT